MMIVSELLNSLFPPRREKRDPIDKRTRQALDFNRIMEGIGSDRRINIGAGRLPPELQELLAEHGGGGGGGGGGDSESFDDALEQALADLLGEEQGAPDSPGHGATSAPTGNAFSGGPAPAFGGYGSVPGFGGGTGGFGSSGGGGKPSGGGKPGGGISTGGFGSGGFKKRDFQVPQTQFDSSDFALPELGPHQRSRPDQPMMDAGSALAAYLFNIGR